MTKTYTKTTTTYYDEHGRITSTEVTEIDEESDQEKNYGNTYYLFGDVVSNAEKLSEEDIENLSNVIRNNVVGTLNRIYNK